MSYERKTLNCYRCGKILARFNKNGDLETYFSCVGVDGYTHVFCSADCLNEYDNWRKHRKIRRFKNLVGD